MSLAFVSVAMFGYNGCSAIMLAFPADVIPADNMASVFGVAALGSGFGGMVFALLTGSLIDHYSFLPAFIFFGLIPIVSLSVVWALMGPLEPTMGIDNSGHNSQKLAAATE